MKLRLSIVAIVLLSFAGAAVALQPNAPGSRDFQNGFGGAAPVDNTTWSVPLTPIFEAAATRYQSASSYSSLHWATSAVRSRTVGTHRPSRAATG